MAAVTISSVKEDLRLRGPELISEAKPFCSALCGSLKEAPLHEGLWDLAAEAAGAWGHSVGLLLAAPFIQAISKTPPGDWPLSVVHSCTRLVCCAAALVAAGDLRLLQHTALQNVAALLLQLQQAPQQQQQLSQDEPEHLAACLRLAVCCASLHPSEHTESLPHLIKAAQLCRTLPSAVVRDACNWALAVTSGMAQPRAAATTFASEDSIARIYGFPSKEGQQEQQPVAMEQDPAGDAAAAAEEDEEGDDDEEEEQEAEEENPSWKTNAVEFVVVEDEEAEGGDNEGPDTSTAAVVAPVAPEPVAVKPPVAPTAKPPAPPAPAVAPKKSPSLSPRARPRVLADDDEDIPDIVL